MTFVTFKTDDFQFDRKYEKYLYLSGICKRNFTSLVGLTLIRIKEITKIESDRIIVTLREDGIVHVYIKPHQTIDLECQQEMHDIYWEMTNVDRPFLFTAGEFISLTREAQRNAKIMEDTVPVAASALVVNGIAQKLMADFYYKIDPPKRPLKVFRDKDKAIDWLKTLDSYKKLYQ